MMCGGDGIFSQPCVFDSWPFRVLSNIIIILTGIADIMGRRFGIHKVPYNKQKSWVGSISMFVVGFLISIGYVQMLVSDLCWFVSYNLI